MVELSQIAGLDPTQLEFLRRRLQKAPKREAGRIPKIVRQSRETAAFPLSFAQRRLWFSDRLEPGNPAYNVGILTRMAGAFDQSLFLRAVGEIFHRHEILRTTYTFVGREPMQVIAAEVRVDLPLVDLSYLPQDRRQPEALRRAAESALRPFDLQRGPLLRTEAFRLTDDEHLLLVSFHHIVSDGWSFGIFVRELAKLYEAFFHGRPSPLPELAVQYADFAVWQRQWLEGSRLIQEQLAWWKERLHGAAPALELPAARPRPAALGHRGRREHRVLPRALEHRLEAAAEAHDVTPFMVELLAFQVLIHLYTGQPDIVVGSPVASRNRSEIEALIGFFANSLVLRTGFAGRPAFRDLLPQVRETVLEAFAHQDLPFESLVEELRPERDLSHQPVFQVMFALQNFQLSPQSLPGLEMIPLDWDLGMSHFDMTLFITPEAGRLLATLRYNQDLYDATTAIRLLDHLEGVLAAMVDEPDRPVTEIAFLRLPERHQLLVEWSAAAGCQILDEGRGAVPIGVVGHVWQDGRQTAELARFRADGTPELLGRAGAQVRIRGFRVDTGQVEERLSGHPAVREVVVTEVDRRLVAYLAASPSAVLEPRELRGLLGRDLPDYMVPSAFVVVAALPRTASGEVDLALLPAPSVEEAAAGRRPRSRSVRFTPFAAARTPPEQTLAGIFREVLDLDEVGIHDSFFELGGHSLLGTVLIARVQEAFGVELPLLRLFEAPTVEGLAAALAAGWHLPGAASEGGIVGAGGGPELEAGSHPLSFPQQRFWLLDQLEPGSTAYNSPMSVRLLGTLRHAALERSFKEIVRRHESLRTTFRPVDDGAVQVVASFTPFHLPLVDLGGLPEAGRQAESMRLAAAETQEPFDLASGPLFRLKLLRMDDREHVVLLTFHHIVFDGWSRGVLIREVAALYEALSAGRPALLPELPIQYVDFACWQRRQLEAPTLQAQLAYWKENLTGPLPTLALPSDRPRGLQTRFQGGSEWVTLSRSVTDPLQRLAERNGVTLFMLLLAIFDTWLFRYSGQPDLLVGTPIANRRRRELEGLIGLFVNTLVLRADLSGDPEFTELLRRVRDVSLRAYAHQDVPFEKVIEEVQPERDLSSPVLFQTMFVLLNAPAPTLEFAGLRLVPMELDSGTAKFDLTVFLWQTDDGLRGGLEYNRHLFDATTARRMLGHLSVLLHGVVEGPGRRLSELPLLTEAESFQVRAEWNDTEADGAEDCCLHELFDAQRWQRPEAVALCFEEQSITYGELDVRAGQLAGRLRRLGVGPEVRVGLCLERSPEMVIAVLGVLEAGGAYVPFEPSYPQERLAFMLKDSGVAVVLTQERWLALLPESGVPLVCLDTGWHELETAAAPPRAQRVHSECVAYAIYTSGSTGRPKGVVNAHRGIVNRLRWGQDRYSLTPEDLVLQKTPFSFDVSIWEFFWPLLVGARLVLARPGGHQDTAYLARLISEMGITTVHFVPSMLQAFLEEPEIGRCTSVSRVFCSGEALRFELQQRFFDRMPGPSLHNLYGPTEAAVEVTYWDCRPNGRGLVPIGRPIGNLRVHVLDGSLMPVPAGVSGELYIGGMGVARGYLSRPELTAERFVPDPLSGGRGARLYRSGDLARLLPGGEVDFQGRIDHQVKIRGFRIELGEIEAELAAMPEVREAAVVACQGQRLAAYVVPVDGREPATAELRQRLLTRLPEYMVPMDWVLLSSLPRTASGKVDRRALPEPGQPADVAQAFVPPRTPLERQLAEIWSEVLRLDKIGIHDNFFALGGDSILSIQVSTRARRAGIVIAPRLLFQHQTLAGLAAAVVPVAADHAEEAEEGTVEGEAPLVPIQRWFLDAAPLDPHHFNQALMLETRQAMDLAATTRALAALWSHHDALRLRFSHAAGGWRQLHAPAGEVAAGGPLIQLDLSALPAERHGPAIETAASRLQAAFDLSRGPLLRIALFDLGAGRPGRLLLIAHHLVVDGVSWRILLEDLEALYAGFLAGRPAVLPAKSTSWRRWTERLAAHARSDEVKAELGFWLSLPNTRPLPLDNLGGADTAGASASLTVTLPAEVTRALLREAPQAYRARLDDLLLTALVQTFARWTGERRLRLDLEGHGREEILPGVDLSRTVGWFTTLFPVVLELPGGGGPGEAIRKIKEQLRAVPRRGIGHGLLRYLSDPAEGASRLAALPGSEVVFNYLGQIDRGISSRFSRASESPGPTRSPRFLRRHRIEVNAAILEESLRVEWTYGSAAHSRRTIEDLAQGFLEALRSLVHHCLSPEAGGGTPSDFPLARLDQAVLDRLLGTGRGIEDLYPLSPMQEGILFHVRYAPDDQVYLEQLTCTLRDLDVPSFQRAWRHVVERQPVLRTAVLEQGLERSLQVVYRSAAMPWHMEDWHGLPENLADERCRNWAELDRTRGFDLAAAPLARAALIRTGDQEFRFVWSFHHLLLDGWSCSLLLREILSAYAAYRRGEEPCLPAAPPYRDYIGWLERQDLRRAEDFWRRRLAGFTTPTPLPFDLPGPGSGRTVEQRETAGRLPAAESLVLTAFAQSRGITSSLLFQAAWGLLLARYSGEDDVVFGAVVANRPADLPGSETMIGLLIDTLPVRVRIEPEASLDSWLQTLHQRWGELLEIEHRSLASIQEWSEVPAGQPLFQTLLAFENYPFQEALAERPGSLEVDALALVAPNSYPLTLKVVPGREISLVHDGRIDSATAWRMLGHLQMLLAGLTAGPGRCVRELPLLTEAERHQLVVEWEPATEHVPGTAPLHRLFEAQVDRAPDAVALTCDGASISYAELSARANRLARHLRRLGVTRGVPVGICAERSLQLIVGLLSILKAGGAYVPLDPSYPEERLAFLVGDALGGTAPVVLTQAELAGRFASEEARTLRLQVVLLEVGSRDAVEGAGNLREGPELEDAAYVIYTSGSTGRPKGVLVTHANVGRLFASTHGWFGFGPGDVWTLFHSFAFDFSVWEIWGALLHGGRLVVVPYWVSRSPEIFYELLGREQVTVLNQTPSAFFQLVQAEERVGQEKRQDLALHWVIFGGEALDLASLRPWFARHGDRAPQLVNMYGITETTVHVTYRPLVREDLLQAHRSPVGIAIPDLHLHLLDAWLEPVPIGVIGEIHVGGAGLSRGYLERPDLTAERFIPDPFASQVDGGARLYKSGDLACRRPDGSLDFLGRADHQVKIRGFRIELGEIEATLAQHPEVGRAVVLARGDGAAGPRLVAYVLPAPGASPPTPADLRTLLSERLPEYMVPAAFVPLEALPLTPTGKIDRGALPEPEPWPALRGGHAVPRTPVEELVAAAWAAVLGVDRVSRDDNFFDLGGHSLLATRVVSQLRMVSGVDLELRELFRHPTVAALAGSIEAALRDSQARQAEPPLVPVARGTVCALSFAQERLWFLDRLEPGSPAYKLPSAILLRGDLDTAVLARALAGVVRRHEALRTTFASIDDRPVQVIHAIVPLALPLVDLASLPAAVREIELRRLAAEEAERPFALGSLPLFRTTLLRRSLREHLVFLTLHHIVSDGWSMGVLVREVALLYEALLSGRPAPLPDLPLQYADFALWQRELLQGERLEGHLTFWKRRFEGAPSQLDLPRRSARTADTMAQSATRRFHLPAPLVRHLEALGRREGSTLFMVLLAAFNVLLHRYTGGEDLPVGFPIANRNRPEIEGLVGLFTNTLVVRTDLRGRPSFTELLQRVREATLEAYAHQDLPFEKLVAELNPDRNLGHSPLFQVMLALQNMPLERAVVPGLVLESFELENVPTRLEMFLEMSEAAGGGLAGRFHFRSDLFDGLLIARLVRHYEVLLEGAVALPGAAAASLPLLSLEERQQLLTEWNDTAVEPPGDLCLHQLFEAQAERCPDAVAIGFEGRFLTYGELDRRAGRLAGRLWAMGIEAEERVGVAVERSPEMMVGVLGILKAGGAYVPLDPDYPRERIDFMLADAELRALVSEERLAERFAGSGVRVLWLEDGENVDVPDGPERRVGTGVGPESLAYLIYTSGSTGRPKGVQVFHSAVTNLLRSVGRSTGISPGDALFAVAPISFDMSVLDFFLPLVSGARLELTRREMAAEGRGLLSALVDSGANFMEATPSTWRLLVDAGWAGGQHLSLFCGGEALPLPLAEALLARCSALWHLYGPTETTVWSTFRLLTRADVSAGVLSVGRPLADTAVYLLDPDLRPVPLGVAGELHIGGAGVARGYLRRPELTAEKFIPDPLGGKPGSRLYKTGDLACRLPDGALEFLGRVDHQVKVRGFRIEPGEIEAALERHPAIERAVVVVRQERAADVRLVACLRPEPATPESLPGAAVLRAFLKECLPAHMVPSVFAWVNAFPLSPNGKIDRRALAERRLATTAGEPAGEPGEAVPRTWVEELLAGIWGEVLGIQEIGPRDDFFDLGGHSLLATQLVSRIQRILGVELPVRRVFELSQFGVMAQELERMKVKPAAAAARLERLPRNAPLPLSFSQHRIWFLERWQPTRGLFHIPVAIRMTGDLRLTLLEASVSEVQRRHETLRTRFVEQGGEPAQVVEPPTPVSLPLLDLSGLPLQVKREETDRLALEAAQHPFELARGFLIRMQVLRLEPGVHLGLLVMHHIVTDGWSMGVLVGEVAALYEAFVAGRPPTLPELTVQYADFAHWQRQRMQGEVLRQHLGYWREQLADAPGALEWPVDRPQSAREVHAAKRRPVRFSRELSDRLATAVRGEGATLFMGLFAAFGTLLFRYSGQRDLVIGTMIANRNQQEIEGLIGLFTNALALRLRLSGALGLRSLLQQVREVAFGAYAHQDLPFEKLVQELNPDRSVSHAPLFQFVLLMQNLPARRMALPGVTLEAGEIDRGAAPYDLFFAFDERGRGVAGLLDYNAHLFDESTISRLLGHFETVLTTAVADLGHPLGNLSLLGGAERHQVVTEWNDTGHFPTLPGNTLVERFEEQAACGPDRIAVSLDPVQLSYGELNVRANRLAHWLLARGVRPDRLTSLLVERSVDMIVAVLGILKAGGAYAPLEPGMPPQRLRFLLDDIGSPVLLTQAPLLPEVAAAGGFAGPVLCLDRDELAGQAAVAPRLPTHLDQLAYVNYTSGSTGAPKGVIVPHLGVARLVVSPDYLELLPDDRVLQLSTYAWDAATFELWGALLKGGRLVLIPKETVLDFRALAGLLMEQGVTALYLTTALFNQVIEQVPGALAGLRALIVGGETASVPHFRQAFEKLPRVRIINEYGPTENTSFSSWHLVDRLPDAGALPIGKPLVNSTVYVLDRALEPVPMGVAGELYLGGDGLARGYLGRPDLTADRFIPNPFVPGERLYKTGDLGRWRDEGTLDFLGRIDFQVKIRGHRVEPAEVEEALKRHHGVQDAVVVLHEPLPQERQLVAYVVPRGGTNLSAPGLRAFLKESLPDYMVPAAFVILAALPLAATGKVDRRALPAPETVREMEGSAPADLTPFEEMVAHIWTQVLGVGRIGPQDDFFELGGHSLMATQVVARVREAFRVELPLRRLFESPTVAAFAREIETARAGMVKGAQSIEPAPRSGEPPLSFAQERLWFLDQLEPGNYAYNLPAAVRCRGRLDIPALQRTHDEIVCRHEVLRTNFLSVEGRARLVVHPPASRPLPLVDLTGISPAAREDEARRITAEEALRPFDLARDPLLRVTLLRLAGEAHVLLATMHHISSDAWSMGVFVREIAALYEAFSRGRSAPLQDLPIQYSDFADWQRRTLQGESLERLLDFWRESLDGGRGEVLALPTDRPRQAVQSSRGAELTETFAPSFRHSLERLCRREGGTLFMSLLAGFGALLHRYTRQTDISVGTLVANRGRVEVEGLIGFFINTLVLRSDLSGEPVFVEHLGRVRETSLAVYTHQDVPFEVVVERLQPERDLSRSPLFQALLVLQNAPTRELHLRDLTLELLPASHPASPHDTSWYWSEEGEGLKVVAEYNSDLFDRTTIVRMLRQFEVLLAAAAAEPAAALSALPVLAAAERHQITLEWNDTTTDRPTGCLHLLVEQQADRTPHAVAATFADHSLTYGELDARANQLAHSLRRSGVGPDARVGVCIERSLELVVALLGILKAGGAYVPLDRRPAERLEFTVRDAGLGLLLTTAEIATELPAGVPRVVSLAPWPFAGESTARIDAGTMPDHLAYVIYTSGSTGRPKGAMNSHRGVHNRLLWMQEAYCLTGRDRILQKTPFTFDVSVWEFFWPLMTGARLVLALPEKHRDSDYLVDLIVAAEVTVVHFVPSLLQGILGASGLDRCTSLRHVICSGEALPAASRNLFFRRSRAALHNLYGPTEASIDVTAWPCEREDAREVVPIGRPISGIEIRILDAHLQAVPAGVPGELYIAGIGLGRGYLGRPDMTAERFIPDPCAPIPDARLYRSGDLARYLEGGEIEFLGRIDHQVKIRGFRIELGEIEEALCGHPLVKAAVVLAREDESGVRRLVAYLISPPGRQPALEELGIFLRQRLPEYMVPSAFVTLDRFPLTSSGKVDRRSLPAPARCRPRLSVSAVPPRTPVERNLARIWEEVLGLEGIGVQDSFIELGGDSILGLKVVARAHREGYRFPLSELFDRRTIEALAMVAEPLEWRGGREEVAASGEPLLEVRPQLARMGFSDSEVDDAHLLSPLQQGLLFHALYAAGSEQYLVETLFACPGRLDLPALRRAWQQVVDRHSALRSIFLWEGQEQPLQIVLRHREAILEEGEGSGADLYLRTGRRERIPDLTRGPLVRLTVFRSAEESFHLVLAYHHLVLDGWSATIAMQELQTLYAAAQTGEALTLSPAQPYRDYVEWLHRQSLERAEGYWRGRLAGFVEPTILGVDRAPGGPPGPEAEFNEHRECLSGSETSLLERLARNRGLTLNTLVQGAWAILLSRYGGEADVVFGTTMAGRPPELPGADSLVGLLINTLPLRIEVEERVPFLEWTHRLQARQIELQAFQHSPLVDVQKWSEMPPGQTLFHYLYVFGNYPDASLAGPGSPAHWVRLRSIDRTNYPLSMEAEPGARLMLRMIHQVGRFERTAVLRMLGGLRGLLQAVTAVPDLPVGELPVLSAAERQQIALEWLDTGDSRPGEDRLTRLFERQAERTPDVVAVVCGEEHLSYQGLHRRAGDQASFLMELGVGPEEVVALLAHRGIDLLTAILAVFRAGGAYLPLDPYHPTGRTLQVLERSAARFVLASREFLPSLAVAGGQPGRRLLLLGEPLPPGMPQGGPPPPAVEGNLAYVIYTSGSTGVPKGVMVEHRGMLNHLWAKVFDLPLTARDIVAQTASQCFDISVWQFLAALLAGGRVHIVSDEVAHDPSRLLDEVQDRGVTVLETVPSLLRLMLEEAEGRTGGRPDLAALRWLIPTGEALPPDSCRRWRKLYSGVALLNAYGPTECSDDVTHHPIRHTPGPEVINMPIGRAIRNTLLYVLDRRLRPVPPEVPGELCVGGDGVGRGYRNDPLRTAAAFVPDPLGGRAGERLYRTGDLVRHLPDGTLEFLGRIDDQVKIRGFRIELGEIETALRRHPGLKQAVVIDLEVAPGDRRLVAYGVPERRPGPNPEELRAVLREGLPEYMVPSAFVFLDALPLTRNGKIDRRALPSPAVASAGRSTAYAPPRSELEQRIAEIWRDVLRIERVGVEDSFFDLGGHSLLIVQVHSRLRKVFATDLAVVDLFKYPTVSGLAAHLSRQGADSGSLDERRVRGELRGDAAGRRRQFIQQKRAPRGKGGSTHEQQ